MLLTEISKSAILAPFPLLRERRRLNGPFTAQGEALCGCSARCEESIVFDAGLRHHPHMETPPNVSTRQKPYSSGTPYL